MSRLKAEATRPPAATIRASAQSSGRGTQAARRGPGPMAAGRGPGRERVRAWSWERGPVHLLPAPPENTRAGCVAKPGSAEKFLAPSPGQFHVRSGSALSDSSPRFAGLLSCPPGRRVTAPRPGHPTRSWSRPRPLGRTVACDPGLAANLGTQTGRPQGRREGAVPSARAPPPHAQLRTSPPCAPSRGSAFLPGKEKRSRLRHRLLKGQHLPSLLILPNQAPPSPPNTCREPPKAWISPLRPLLLPGSVTSPARWIGRAGPGVGFVRLLCSGSYCCWKGHSKRGHLCGPAGEPRRWRIWEATSARRWVECWLRLRSAGRRLAVSGRSSSFPGPSLSLSRCVSLAHPPAPTPIRAGYGTSAKPDRYFAVVLTKLC